MTDAAPMLVPAPMTVRRPRTRLGAALRKMMIVALRVIVIGGTLVLIAWMGHAVLWKYRVAQQNAAFDSLATGMSKSQVRDAMGTPDLDALMLTSDGCFDRMMWWESPGLWPGVTGPPTTAVWKVDFGPNGLELPHGDLDEPTSAPARNAND